MVTKWINRWTQALQVCMEVMQLKPHQVQEIAAAATQASAAVKAVSELRAQDDRILRAEQISPATMPALPITYKMNRHLMINQLQRLQEQLPTSQLDRMAHWALQEGLASIAPAFANLTSPFSTNVALLRETDPFGILMAMETGSSLHRMSVSEYMAALVLIKSQAGVFIRPDAADSIVQYCAARQLLARTWSDNARTSSAEVRSAVSAYIGKMLHEVGQTKAYMHGLMAWRAAHQLMLRRDKAQVNFPLLYLQLEAKCGSVKQNPEAWAKLRGMEANWEAVLKQAALDSTTLNSEPTSDRDDSQSIAQGSRMKTHAVPSGTTVKETCQQLMQGIEWLRGVLYPHKSVSAEVSALLAEYEAEVTARLSQVGLRVGSL